uniref:Glycosyltransferase n=1 Tax=Thermodesulfobacterium geofontis TaxID=1295609 RepID=A0A7V5XFX7_9BACT
MLNITKNFELSIILPAYNQEKLLKESIEKIKGVFADTVELIIVDDGSTDNTLEVVKELLNVKIIINPHNMGKGYSVKKGMLSAKGKYRIFTDADLPYGVKGIKKIFEKLKNNYDIAIGQRINPYPQNPTRLFCHKIFNFFVRKYLKIPFKDTQCGLKGFKANVAEEVFKNLTINGFAFDIELLCFALKKGYKICIVEVEQLKHNVSTITLKDLFKIFNDVRKIKKIYT